MSVKQGQCVHFNGAQNKLCSRGVNYEQFWPGIPCIQFVQKLARGSAFPQGGEATAEMVPFGGAQPKERCPFYQEPTEDQVRENSTKNRAALTRFMTAIAVALEWRVTPKPAKDRIEVVRCPICDGNLHLLQSAYNGHVHGKCETQGCVSWME